MLKSLLKLYAMVVVAAALALIGVNKSFVWLFPRHAHARLSAKCARAMPSYCRSIWTAPIAPILPAAMPPSPA